MEKLDHNGTWRTFTTSDGLASNRVEHIVEDREGYLWFATWSGGVSRYDGDEFRTFTTSDGLCGNQVCALHLDGEGRLWLGTLDGGLCWSDGHSFHRFADPEVCNHSATSIFTDCDGRVWVAGGLISYYDGATFHHLMRGGKRGECWGIAQDDTGSIWFGFDKLLRFDGRNIQPLDQVDGLPPRDFIYAVASAPQEGNIWLGGQEIGRYDGQTYQRLQGPVNGYVRKIQTDRQGRTWFCTGGDGVYCYDGNEFHHFTSRDGLAHNVVNSVAEDREGHLWFATWGGGVSRYDANSVQVFDQRMGSPPGIPEGLLEDQNGRLWAGFPQEDKIACYDGSTASVFGGPLDLSEHSVVFCQDRQRQLWLGDHKGLAHFNGQLFERVEDEFSGVFVTAITADVQGGLLLGHWEEDRVQLTRYDGRNVETLWSTERAPNRFNITRILQRRNNELWIATGTMGGVGIGKGLGRLRARGEIEFYTAADGLPDDRVEDLVEDREGGLWIATAAGLCHFDGVHFRTFTTADGLPNNYVQCLWLDGRDRLWIGTESGVARYDGQTIQTLHSEYIASTHNILEGRSQCYWFATIKGLVRYLPGCVPPRVRLHQVLADRVYHEPTAIEVAQTVRQLVFEFKGMSFRTRPQHMLYTYQLQGFDKDWLPPARAQRAYYNDLPAGDYTFQVRAIDCDQNYSAPASIEVHIHPDPHLEMLNESLRAGGAGEFVGQSPALEKVQAQITQVAPTEMTTLILGETGTGKGLAARMLHTASQRQRGPFIQVNCGAIPQGLIESELFGHEKGAFTGSDKRRLGKVELAKGGTLFLDEIGDMPLDAQTRLLRLLEEKVFERLGGSETLEVDARIVAATNRDLEKMVREQTFRQDLYFRLRTFPIQVPPLRERQEDIPLLVYYFTETFARHLDRPVPELSSQALDWLRSYEWPGNVRELEHLVQRAVLVCRDHCIAVEDLAVSADSGASISNQAFLSLAENEKRHIERALMETGGVVFGAKGAARLLGVNPETLRYRIKKHGLK